ncbi:creatininase family protein [Frondihabitans sp. PAMC 28766]|uniref:creatininase family protein n=1 Tax=Frondihabitans sp. PAMC 28766 TaxID=1795630 RepID=UPI000B055257|nr:creatininase family protein [Frondihabitans sp. PAMC 28766]
MSGTEVRAELLSPAEIDAALGGGSVVYIPLGSLEFHQAHLPIGLDSLNAHGVCAAAAMITGGVVLPTVYQGTGGGHGDYPWSIMMPTGDALEANLTATLQRLDDFGVLVAVVFSGTSPTNSSTWSTASARPGPLATPLSETAAGCEWSPRA